MTSWPPKQQNILHWESASWHNLQGASVINVRIDLKQSFFTFYVHFTREKDISTALPLSWEKKADKKDREQKSQRRAKQRARWWQQASNLCSVPCAYQSIREWKLWIRRTGIPSSFWCCFFPFSATRLMSLIVHAMENHSEGWGKLIEPQLSLSSVRKLGRKMHTHKRTACKLWQLLTPC